MDPLIVELIELSHRLGDPNHGMAILAEGNASAKTTNETFFIKASGRSMGSLTGPELVEVKIEPILGAFDLELDDNAVRERLKQAKVDPTVVHAPSVETFMHAYLLTLPGVGWVAHTHPQALLALLSVQDAESRASQRLFPDEVVCCGPASCYVPYVDPGLPLARAIRDAVEAFIEAHGESPKTIWLQNHGLIALGRSSEEAWSAIAMSEKAARVWQAALATGLPIHPLTRENVERIHNRPDEHHRQQLLWQVRRPKL